jgi:hypothetical protein
MCGPKFCSMKITQEVRDFAARHGLGEQEALRAGMDEKSAEFAARGGEFYVPVQIGSRHSRAGGNPEAATTEQTLDQSKAPGFPPARE